MRRAQAALGVMAVFTLTSCVVVAPGGDPSPGAPAFTPLPTSSRTGAPSEGDEREYAEQLVAHSNEARVEEGLTPLGWSDCAAEQGQERAAALVGSDELSHAPLGPVLEACAPVARAAENLSKGGVSAARIVEAWLGSPGHRRNILDPDVTQAGAGCVPVDEDGFLCSMIFLG